MPLVAIVNIDDIGNSPALFAPYTQIYLHQANAGIS